MENLDCGELNQILDRINGWIENCDSKASIILSGMGVFSGIFLANNYVSKVTSIFRTACNDIGIATIVYLAVSFFSLGLLTYGFFYLLVFFLRELIQQSSKTERLNWIQYYSFRLLLKIKIFQNI